jgi:peptide deformylase
MKSDTNRYQYPAGKVAFVNTLAVKGWPAKAENLCKIRPWLCVLRPSEASSSEGGFANYINALRLKLNISTRFLFCLFLITPFISCSPTRSATEKSKHALSFSSAQKQLISAGDSHTPMRVYKINDRQDSLLLRRKSEDVNIIPNDPFLETFIQRLYATVRDSMSLGVGIAAPQVGILKNIIWVQRFDKENFPFEVYLNPKIVQYSNLKQDCLEGCLSIPNRSDTTRTRSYAILVEYEKPDKTHQSEMIEDFTAVIFQHEIDHLNGILYLDHLEKEIQDAKKPD